MTRLEFSIFSLKSGQIATDKPLDSTHCKEKGVRMTKFDVVRLVLKKMVELYEVDTSVIWPDDPLTESGIDEQMAQKIFRECLVEIGMERSRETSMPRWPLTARSLVDAVFAQVEESKANFRIAS